jgi:hypothetical protein
VCVLCVLCVCVSETLNLIELCKIKLQGVAV